MKLILMLCLVSLSQSYRKVINDENFEDIVDFVNYINTTWKVKLKYVCILAYSILDMSNILKSVP